QPISFEAWQEANPHLVNMMSSSAGSNHIAKGRHSSVFRGISMASQLLDRSDEQPIQLPISASPNTNNGLFSSHQNTRQRDSALLGNILNGITSAITSHTHPSSSIHSPTTDEDADAVEIDIPTPSSFNFSDRELMPISNKQHHTDLVDIESDRDLS
ncbi:hypothetical protein A0J61_02238, partial [Choanephora cucurbitarum]